MAESLDPKQTKTKGAKKSTPKIKTSDAQISLTPAVELAPAVAVPETVAPGPVEVMVLVDDPDEDDAGQNWSAGVAREWAAELADYVLAAQPTHPDARQIKGRALTELGERQGNANARNYYLSSAQFYLK